MRSRLQRLPVTPEKAIQGACLHWLALNGACAIRVNSGGMKVVNGAGGPDRYVPFNHMRGCSDILACWRGRFVAIEVKSATGRVRPEQEEFLQRVRDAGGIGIIVRSVDELAAELAR